MSKSYVLTHRFQPHLTFTLGVDSLFVDILELSYIDMSELSQGELDTFLGIISVLDLGVNVKEAALSTYVLRCI